MWCVARPSGCAGENRGRGGARRGTIRKTMIGAVIVALDCVEIDELAPVNDVIEAQDLADRVAAMLTKLIRSVEINPR